MGRHIFAKVSSGMGPGLGWQGQSPRAPGSVPRPALTPTVSPGPAAPAGTGTSARDPPHLRRAGPGAAAAPLPEPDGTDWKPQHLHKPDVPGGMGAPPRSPGRAQRAPRSPQAPAAPPPLRIAPLPVQTPRVSRSPPTSKNPPGAGKRCPCPGGAASPTPSPAGPALPLFNQSSSFQTPAPPDVLHYFCEQVLYKKKTTGKKKGSILYSGFVFD